MTKRQQSMVQKWINDARIKNVIESLRKVKIELKSKVRHMRDRLGRKAKREAIKLDPSLKPKKKTKPVNSIGLGSQSDLFKQMLLDEGLEDGDDIRSDYYVPEKKKKKNRLGQRARRRLAEEAETAKASGTNRSQRRAKALIADTSQPSEVLKHKNRRQKRERRMKELSEVSNSTGSIDAVASAPKAKKARHSENDKSTTESTVHPSWQARSLAKEKQQNAKFAGIKVTFDESDDDE
jgi:hypothetical protein